MRTTVDLDDAVLAAAKSIARDEGVSLGVVLSRLAKQGLERRATISNPTGFPVFAADPQARPITLELVNAHRDGD